MREAVKTFTAPGPYDVVIVLSHRKRRLLNVEKSLEQSREMEGVWVEGYGDEPWLFLGPGVRLIGTSWAKTMMNGRQYEVVSVGDKIHVQERELRANGQRVEHRMAPDSVAKEVVLCYAVTAASCQGEEYGSKVCVRDLAHPHMTKAMFRTVTSRARNSADMCCLAD